MARRLFAAGATAVFILLLASMSNHPPSAAAVANDMHMRGSLCVDLSCGEAAYGLEVVATIDGHECGRDTSGPFQEDGDPRVTAGFDITVPSAQDVPGCGTPGASVDFTVDGRPVHEHIEWYATEDSLFQLSVGDAAYLSGYIHYGDDWYSFPCNDLCEGPYIKAFVNGVLCGELQTLGSSSRSYYRYLVVAGADAKPGCAHDGDTVTFTVDDVPAHEEFTWYAGFSSSDVSVGPRSAHFRGHACIDADCSSAMLGHPVVAKIGDVVCGQTQTDFPISDGQVQSLYEIAVAPTEKTAGCGTDGATVDLYIDGRKTAQTATWTDGTNTYLDLWVGADFAAFSGWTTCDGKPCYNCFSPCPTANITAYVDGKLCGSMHPDGWLIINSYGPLVVKSDESEPGCGTPGGTVTFKINDKTVAETASWSPGFHAQQLTAGDEIWGDTDCSRALDGGDALLILRYLASDQPYAACFSLLQQLSLRPFGMQALWADIDCSGGVTPLDALKTLLAASELAIEQAPGCPPPGSLLQALPLASP